ncbi:DUF4157 domain-containing protein [Heliobacterium gestii]|uniref:DUF4157 domain-containing protein n=2 Tax=Heliomicrobium gestii TaxID=2699 RepID=A0A845LBK7_HELGE|nr:DUF4157 domain-containing protein [Heliomicrobium gestii]
MQLQRVIGNRAVMQLLESKDKMNQRHTNEDEKTNTEESRNHKLAETIQRRENNTGMPDNLKSGVESLSGLSLSDVKVHYNSSNPAKVGALAYTQGKDIHVAPGQERHLPHEAWHAVQQKQGRVAPTLRMNQTVQINDDKTLEAEADVMGARALQMNRAEHNETSLQGKADSAFEQNRSSPPDPQSGIIQRMLVGCELETMVPIYENGTRPDHVDGYKEQNTTYTHQNVDGGLSKPLGEGFAVHVDSSSLAHRAALNLLNKGSRMHIAELVAKPVSSREALLANLQIAKNYLSVFEGTREITGAHYSMGWPTPAGDCLSKEAITVPRDTLEDSFAKDYASTKSQLYSVSTQLTFQGTPDKLAEISNLDTREYVAGKTVVEVPKKYGKGMDKRIRDVKKEDVIVNRASMAEALGMSGRLGESLVARAIDVTVKIFKDALSFLQKPQLGTVKNAVSYLIRSDLGRMFVDQPPEARNGFATNIAEAIQTLTPERLAIPPKLLETIYDTEKNAIKLHDQSFKLLKGLQGEELSGELEHVNKSLTKSIKDFATEDTGYYYWPWAAAMEWLANEVKGAVQSEAHDVTGPLHGLQNLGLLAERDHGEELHERQATGQVAADWAQRPNDYEWPEEEGATTATQPPSTNPGVVFEDRTSLQIDISGSTLPAEIVESLNRVGF